MCPSLIEIGSKTAEKNSAQTNRQTDKQTNRHYENNGHFAVNQLLLSMMGDTHVYVSSVVRLDTLLLVITESCYFVLKAEAVDRDTKLASVVLQDTFTPSTESSQYCRHIIIIVPYSVNRARSGCRSPFCTH